MTKDDILAAIAASPALQAKAAVWDHQGIADALPPEQVLVSTPIGVGTIVAKFGEPGGAFLDKLQEIGGVRRDIHWLLQANVLNGSFDVGMPETRAGLEGLKLAIPQYATGIDKLLALGVRLQPVTAVQVIEAIGVERREG